MHDIILQVSEALAVINQTLDYAYPALSVQGEVSGFKVSQGKWVFFDLKDETGTISCFMSLSALNIELCDGMQIIVRAKPTITKWGKFSLTVQRLQPIGEGSIKKAFDLLKNKLTSEGLFAPDKKRPLPYLPSVVGVISSTDSAGYRDFIKVISNRFPELSIKTYHVQVQGLDAPAQIIQGIEYFNGLSKPPEVLAIIRGGGSADDLAAFNDEALVRKIAGSRVPTITGIGHEVDTTLADLAADLRASTPSNAAELLMPDRRELISETDQRLAFATMSLKNQISSLVKVIEHGTQNIQAMVISSITNFEQKLAFTNNLLTQLNPDNILRKGYFILRNKAHQIIKKPASGDSIYIERLPKAGYTASLDDFAWLNGLMNGWVVPVGGTMMMIEDGGYDIYFYPVWLPTGVWEGTFAGNYSNVLHDQGYYGNYWSSTAHNASRARHQPIQDDYIDSGYDAAKYTGHSIRCVI